MRIFRERDTMSSSYANSLMLPKLPTDQTLAMKNLAQFVICYAMRQIIVYQYSQSLGEQTQGAERGILDGNSNC